MENLAIISKEMFDEVQKRVSSREKKKDKQIDRTITQGHGLCSGFIYCGECGSKMSPWSKVNKYQKKDGTTVNYIAYRYRCSKKSMGRESDCGGQRTYGIVKINHAVEADAIPYMAELCKKGFTPEFLEEYDKQIVICKTERKTKENEFAQRHKALDGLKREFANLFSGDSIWSQHDLKEAIELQKTEIESCKAQISDFFEKERVTEEEKSRMVSVSQKVQTWVDKYLNASFDIKKNLLFEMIERVEVFSPKNKEDDQDPNDDPDPNGKVRVGINYKVEAMALNHFGCYTAPCG